MTESGPNDTQQIERVLIDLVVESWRLSRLFGRVTSKLDAGEAGRHGNQIRYFHKRLQDSLADLGMSIVNVEGQPFDPGMAASALNVGDFGPDEPLLVEQMLEPIIMGRDGLKKQGTVLLRRAAT